MSYAPYPTYKDSGVPWLGQVPEGWEPKKIKYLVNYIGSGKTPRGGAEIYTDDGIMILRSQNVYDDGLRLKDVAYVTPEVEAQQINTRVQPADVLLNITGASIGRSSIVPDDLPTANVNQHVCIFRPQRTKIVPEFLHAFFCSSIGKEQVTSNENGTSREGLNFQQAGNLHLVLPPIEEQTAIADFLDKKTTEIDDLIAKKEELLRLLAEQRTALITHAVTKGLNPNAPMKPSGIDWLDEMPQHWINPRIQHVVQLRSGEAITSGSIADAGDFPVYGGNGFRGYSDRYTHKGDFVLVGRQGALCGNVNYASGKFWASEHALVANPLREFVVDWMGELLRAMNLNQYSVSAAQPGLSVDNIAKLRIPLPPIEEQREIATHIKRETLEISNVEKAAEKAIKKLREYRTALITNAVTGKIKVA
ncbi:type I restriction enzyme, S subunit [Aliiroseovarius crassostreae]|uniref:Type I restriction modification DNA specificity domain-containing protein n=1 Tax=Aliiroseovarius crassostreae TaxID=154981 RepID=A0A0N8IBG4_9RHOB|nr:restriction endonuclease subunit S [Aliiroseovarius crassostreae]KPN63035.1 hypothetical protein AKJ29_02485 [Aliiroseovarius crassostreae]SFU67524.1 type I restriction enzyme, S subunit [Aliiroseovarius crassostreae]